MDKLKPERDALICQLTPDLVNEIIFYIKRHANKIDLIKVSNQSALVLLSLSLIQCFKTNPIEIAVTIVTISMTNPSDFDSKV